MSPSKLSKFDVPQPVLDVLSRSAVKHVVIIGRRGPLEAAFATKELREMMNLPDVSMVPLPADLLAPPSGISLTRQQTRIMEILRNGSKHKEGTASKTWSLEFFRSPTSIQPPSPSSPSATLTLTHTTVDPITRRAITTGESSTLATSLVITSLGFGADPLTPFYDQSVRHLRTSAGRIVSTSGTVLKNMYASGWAATGAKGVLAATMMDAYAVAETIASDWLGKGQSSIAPGLVQGDCEWEMNATPHPDDPPPEIRNGLAEGNVLEYGDWKAVDAEEVIQGERQGKERERMGWDEVKAFLAAKN